MSVPISSLQYNTHRVKLIIPEYGRHVQKMIDFAVSIQDREERNRVAQSIIAVMGNLQPHLRDVPEFQHKLWDQLLIMSNFKLDVDAPFVTLTQEKLSERPEPLGYPQNHPKYRFYGNTIKRMIDVACEWEEGELKRALVFNIANHMKKSYLSWNKDVVEDKVIFTHLFELSEGRIDLIESDEDLSDSSELMRSKRKKMVVGKKNYRSHKKKDWKDK